MMVVYGYSRLVGYDEQLNLVPDILESVENVDEPRCSRSTCAPATAGRTASRSRPADFRYFWEDVANNTMLSPFGLPRVLHGSRHAARASKC